jgi:hypothetical protein
VTGAVEDFQAALRQGLDQNGGILADRVDAVLAPRISKTGKENLKDPNLAG